ncbi:META domain-containing protein [Jannaschia ovalis]|uniref:META domain-containing protein n=1 Tax=Jannaschia ovalis TaxID=3038773 RepID=A0ABY8LD14_9RHOB|nr:META domain-containing protein [Jannaschia sp. GRR-S6-38]WGH79207.1 META domain-containing protein [Jannaschia sp. GRR-S6-38]
MRALALLLLLAACRGDETISGYSDRATVWRLTELDGAPFAAPATLRFPEPSLALGAGPCNVFRAAQSAPYPWLEIGPVAATRRACPALEAETRYFAALEAMTLAEASDRVLILSDAAGREMVFVAEPQEN